MTMEIIIMMLVIPFILLVALMSIDHKASTTNKLLKKILAELQRKEK